MLWRQSADLLRQRLVGTAWGLDCRHYVGRSSCPRLLREGFLVARLYDLQGTVSLQAAKPPPTGPPRWPRTICSASPLWQSERSPKPHPDKRTACEMKVLTSCLRLSRFP